ncbi:MAG: FkbM family methyltransferase [Chitinophagaceae bacterium]
MFDKINPSKILKKGILLTKTTEIKKVNALIESLYPYKIQTDLIRLGSNGDGGYLLPNDLEGIEACFSPGVATVSEFEMDCLKLGMKVYMADKSVEKPNLNVPEDTYDFIKKFVGCTNNDDFITMDEWVNSKCSSEKSDLLLQMDIEGGEYHTLINTSDTLMKRFRIIVIEFHKLHNLWNPYYYDLNKVVFDKILQTHICVHIHPNNIGGFVSKLGVKIPRLAEFTFIRKDRVTSKSYANQFPHQLDSDNTNKKTLSLPKNWYKANH